ncbi:MAG TPA: DUF493 domain-containing protein [Levilinea sp.]|nr:DUF493 domain-containing protein [Levilinea sp.]
MDNEFENRVLKFPTAFPLKVIGPNEDDFETYVVRLVARHVPYLDSGNVSSRESSQGKYLSVTLTFIAESRAQVDAIYMDLTASERVVFVL